MRTLHACDTWARIGPATTFNDPVKHAVQGAKKLINTQASILEQNCTLVVNCGHAPTGSHRHSILPFYTGCLYHNLKPGAH